MGSECFAYIKRAIALLINIVIEKSCLQKIIFSVECQGNRNGFRGIECAIGPLIDSLHLRGVMEGLSPELHLVTYLLNLFSKDGVSDYSGT